MFFFLFYMYVHTPPSKGTYRGGISTAATVVSQLYVYMVLRNHSCTYMCRCEIHSGTYASLVEYLPLRISQRYVYIPLWNPLSKQYNIREFSTANYRCRISKEKCIFVKSLQVKKFCRIFVHMYTKFCKNCFRAKRNI